jgi:hypothetical protein
MTIIDKSENAEAPYCGWAYVAISAPECAKYDKPPNSYGLYEGFRLKIRLL